MTKIVTYSEEQVMQLKGILNGITTTGVQNAKQIAAISQILESGIPAEIKEKTNSDKPEGGE